MVTAKMDCKTKEQEVISLLNISFPDIDFRVESFYCGHYKVVSIQYRDGVTCSEVRRTVNHLKQIAIPTIHFPRLRFEIDREMSKDTELKLLEETKLIFDLPEIPSRLSILSRLGYTVDKYIRLIFSTRTF